MPNCLGKQPAQHDPRVLHMTTVAPSILAYDPPSEVMRCSEIPKWILGLNDYIGDCAIVSAANSVLARSTWAGHTLTLSDWDIETAYAAVSGYNPGARLPDGSNPTDTGITLHAALQYWMATGIGSNRLIGYAQIDPRNERLLRSCISVFGDVYPGWLLDLAQQQQAEWRPVPGSKPWGGHAALLNGYARDGSWRAASWGELLSIAPDFPAAQCDEAFVLLDADSITAGTATFSDWNMDALATSIRALGGAA